jgi:GxxExxY protein
MDEFIYKEEGYKIIGCFYAVYNNIGPGFLESVYQEALAIEFDKIKIPYLREQKLDIFYNEDKLKKHFKADFICFNEIIVETKAQKFIVNTDIVQVINYLSATKIKLAYLVNFGAPKLYYKRIICTDKKYG